MIVVFTIMEKQQKVVTSIKIDPEVWKKAKIEAINQGRQLSDLVEEAIMELIASQKDRRK